MQLLTYLHQSVKINQPHLVEFFLDKIQKTIPPEDQKYLFKSINLNLNTVDRTDVSILRRLKACGVPFSKNAECIIDKKEKQPTGYLLPIGIMLNKFTDFIKECLYQPNEVNKFHELKKQATQDREKLAKDTGSEPKINYF